MTERSEILSRVLCFERRKCSNELALMVGRFGAGWALEVLAEVFEEIPEKEAEIRARLLRAISTLFVSEMTNESGDVVSIRETE